MVDGQKVYHENQRSSLCGQHTINSALQAPIFNQHALNQFADRLRHTEILKRNPYCDEFGVNFIPLIDGRLKPFIFVCGNNWALNGSRNKHSRFTALFDLFRIP